LAFPFDDRRGALRVWILACYFFAILCLRAWHLIRLFFPSFSIFIASPDYDFVIEVFILDDELRLTK
jgi:hypothetical protein